MGSVNVLGAEMHVATDAFPSSYSGIYDTAIIITASIKFYWNWYCSFIYLFKSASTYKRMTDLTHLNWVAGVPIPPDFSGTRPCARPLFPISVDSCADQGRSSTASCRSWTLSPNASENGRSTRNRQLTFRSRRRKDRATATNKGKYKKPDCSYTCLIAMALFASERGFLPVNEIYKSIEWVGNCVCVCVCVCVCSLETRPSKNRKGGSGISAGMEVYTVEC